jgi:O-acetylhomoserine/O-acetylserine sulfhydrylase
MAGQRFETLQLHAGYVFSIRTSDNCILTINSQEPDPATNSRAVPIYATTVRYLSSATSVHDSN